MHFSKVSGGPYYTLLLLWINPYLKKKFGVGGPQLMDYLGWLDLHCAPPQRYRATLWVESKPGKTLSGNRAWTYTDSIDTPCGRCMNAGVLSCFNMNGWCTSFVPRMTGFFELQNRRVHTQQKHQSVAVPPVCRTYVTWPHDIMSWHHTIGDRFGISLLKSESPGNNVFEPGDLNLWPMTLTIELVWDVMKVNPCAKFHDRTPNGLAVKALTDRQTRTHSHGQLHFYNLDRWRGR